MKKAMKAPFAAMKKTNASSSSSSNQLSMKQGRGVTFPLYACPLKRSNEAHSLRRVWSILSVLAIDTGSASCQRPV
jgi:hypothetical protein